MYSHIYHPLSQSWMVGKIEEHTAKSLTQEEAKNIADLLNGCTWNHVAESLPEKGDVVMVSITVPDGTEGVGMAAFNGVCFNDFDGKMILGVNLWMQIPPRPAR